MIKYKMITICSLSIVCILILSLLLPLTTSANDKESLELKMHYQNSEVALNITVNSEVYTGVICKYIMTDDVLTSENLLEETKQNGTAVNLDKNETDIYTTTISNVTTRYVVIYVSIGNCNICDYIDCKPNEGKTVQTETTNNQEEIVNNENQANVNNENNTTNNIQHEEIVQNENVNKEQSTEEQKTANTENALNNENKNNIQQIEKNENNSNKSNQNNSKQEQIIVDSNESNNTSEEFELIEDISVNTDKSQSNQNQEQNNQSQSNQNQEQNNQNQSSQNQEQNSQNQSNQNQEQNNLNQSNQNQEQNSQNQNKEQDLQNQSQQKQEQVVQKPEEVQQENKVEQNTVGSKEQQNSKEESIQNAEISKDKINLQIYDKDSIDIKDFEEIEKTTTVTTADQNMPQTGENDTVKIMGIIIFSMVAGISFYKYQKTK